MEDTSVRTLLITAVAPVAWGTTYLVTESFLPQDRPLFAAAARALPAGLVLLAFRRQLPHGEWWWKAVLLGLCNIGLFFPLIFLAAYELPGGLAATVQALSPLAVMAIALPALGERPGARRVVAGLVGILGVGLLVLRSGGHVSTLGLVAAVGSVVVSALGFVLVKRWPSPTDMLTTISWQLVAGGLVLAPVALLVEGAPPALSATNVGGLLWLTTMGTAVAYYCWFRGLVGCPPAPCPWSGWSTRSSAPSSAWRSPASCSGGRRPSGWCSCSAAWSPGSASVAGDDAERSVASTPRFG